MKRKHRRHSEEFKREVLQYSIDSSKSIKQICKEFDISPALFYAWKKKLWGSEETERAVGERWNGAAPEASVAELGDEIRRLRKELEKAHRREEILKKAALILGTDPRDNMS